MLFVWIIGALVLLFLFIRWIATVRWRSGATLHEHRLRSELRPARPRTFRARDLEGLPAPVQRYFRHVLREGQPLVNEAIVHHAGTFRLGDGKNAWRPFRSREHFTMRRPGFLWEASIHVLPGIDVFVRDSYIGGEGGLHASLGGLFTLSRPEACSTLDQAALQRYLAEAMWIPTLLLSSEQLQWAPIDDRTAKATLNDHGVSASLVFSFNSDNEIIRAHAPARMQEKNGIFTPHPWTARCWNYAERGGMRIPLDAEVLWHFPQGDHPYWRGHITQFDPDPSRVAEPIRPMTEAALLRLTPLWSE